MTIYQRKARGDSISHQIVSSLKGRPNRSYPSEEFLFYWRLRARRWRWSIFAPGEEVSTPRYSCRPCPPPTCPSSLAVPSSCPSSLPSVHRDQSSSADRDAEGAIWPRICPICPAAGGGQFAGSPPWRRSPSHRGSPLRKPASPADRDQVPAAVPRVQLRGSGGFKRQCLTMTKKNFQDCMAHSGQINASDEFNSSQRIIDITCTQNASLDSWLTFRA